MTNPVIKRKIQRILPYGIIWFIAGMVYTLLERGLLGSSGQYYSTGNPYNFSRSLMITPIAALLMGFLMGTIETIYLNKRLNQNTLGKKILYKSLIDLTVILVFIVLTTLIANSLELGVSLLDKKVISYLTAFLGNYAFISVSLYMILIIVITQFYMEVREHIGPSVLANFLSGRYHRPIEEDRIFMFLDMRSSTLIAEQLGHLRYFDLLRQYYSDLSDALIAHEGEVYQYVGDEMVLTWNLNKGLQNNNCLQCFYSMKKSLQQQSHFYQQKFGVVPGFKAGLHWGRVTTGEIGVLKKEIIFTGDVLNTTARIQSLCNDFKTELLISGELISKLNEEQEHAFHSLGIQQLRGREEPVQLFTVK